MADPAIDSKTPSGLGCVVHLGATPESGGVAAWRVAAAATWRLGRSLLNWRCAGIGPPCAMERDLRKFYAVSSTCDACISKHGWCKLSGRYRASQQAR